VVLGDEIGVAWLCF